MIPRDGTRWAALLLLAGLLAAPVGCKSFLHLDPRRSASDFYPLAIGNRWVYLDSTGTELEEVLTDHIGEYFYNAKTRLGTSHVSDGVMQANFYKGIARSPRHLIKVPLTIGAIWKAEDLLYEITDTDKRIQVRAGHFENCLEVRVRHKREFVTHREKNVVETYVTITFAPGVGPVEWVTRQGNRVIYRKELLRYQPA
ncbi:MAG: hypothetical protein ACE5FC_00545 [Myxococcota bacterium]